MAVDNALADAHVVHDLGASLVGAAQLHGGDVALAFIVGGDEVDQRIRRLSAIPEGHSRTRHVPHVVVEDQRRAFGIGMVGHDEEALVGMYQSRCRQRIGGGTVHVFCVSVTVDNVIVCLAGVIVPEGLVG